MPDMDSLFFLQFTLVLALFPSVMGLRAWHRWYYLRREGVSIPAEVRYHWMTRSGLLEVYTVIYEIEGMGADGEPFFFSRSAQIERELYNVILDGEPLNVIYAASKPHLFRLEGETDDLARWTFGGIVAWAYFFFILAVLA